MGDERLHRDLDGIIRAYTDWEGDVDSLASQTEATPELSRVTAEDVDDAWEALAGLIPVTPADPLLGLLKTYVDAETDFWHHPTNMAVIPGCDCGCGGDSVSDEEWAAFPELKAALENAFEALKVGLEQKGVELT